MCDSESSNIISNDGEMVDLSQLQISSNSEASYKTELFHIENRLTPEICNLIINGTREQQFMGTAFVRKLLSGAQFVNVIEDMLNTNGLINKIVEFLDCMEDQRLQFEASCVIVSLSSSSWSYIKALINAGSLHRLIKLIDSANDDLQEKVILAIGNIAINSKEFRDILFSLNVLEPLLKLLQNKKLERKSINREIWCLMNLCLNKMDVSMEDLKQILPVLDNLLKTQTDTEALVNICWSISYLCDAPNENIQVCMDLIDLGSIIELLDNDQLIKPVLRVFGNIATGDDLQCDTLIQLGLIEYLQKLIDHNKYSIKSEVCWILSNLTADNRNQIQAVIDSGIIQKAISMFPNGDLKIKSEIAWILGNLITSGSRDQIVYIVENGAIEILLDYLENKDKSIDSRMIFNWLKSLVDLIDPQKDDIISKKCQLLNLAELVRNVKRREEIL